MADQFANSNPTIDGPAANMAVVTPNDSTDLPRVARGLILSAAGTVTVDMVGEGTNISVALQAGGPHPIRVKRVYATGTDAIDIRAVW